MSIMDADKLFNAGITADIVPEGDAARQAVDSPAGLCISGFGGCTRVA